MTRPSMRRLMLLRHAKSEWPDGVDDHERPLARRGRRASPLIGNHMVEAGLMPDLVIVSTARRAQETWDLVRPALRGKIGRRDEPRIYEAPAGSILEVIHETPIEAHTLLLVGHNPGFQDLALELTGQGRQPDLTRMREKYPTGGLAVIDFDIGTWRDVAPAAGELQRFVTPRSLADAA